MPQILSDLAGTLRSAFRVAQATFNAAGLTAARTVTLPDKSGTLAMLDDLGAGGDVDWTVVTAGQNLADNVPLLANITTAQTFPIPASVNPGDEYVLRNSSSSAALASIDPGAGRQIQGCPVADTLTIDAGDTATLVARTSTFFELVTPGAVGPTGPAGAPSIDAHPLGVRLGFAAVSGSALATVGMTSLFNQGTPTIVQATSGSDAFNAMVVRQRITGTTSTTSIASFYLSIPYVRRDRGFEVMFMGAPSDGFVATTRFFMGVHNQTGGFSNADPSTFLNIIGIGYDSADANLQVMRNDGSGTATKIDLGASFPRPSTPLADVYRLELSCAPGASSVSYVVRKLNAPTATASGVLTSDLPASTTELTMGGCLQAGGTNSAPSLSFFGLSFKSNY